MNYSVDHNGQNESLTIGIASVSKFLPQFQFLPQQKLSNILNHLSETCWLLNSELLFLSVYSLADWPQDI